MALTLAGNTGHREHSAARLDADVGALVRPDAGPLDVRREANAEVATVTPRGGLLGSKTAHIDDVLGQAEPGGVVAAVVASRRTVLKWQPHVPRELIWLDEIAPPDLVRLELELARNAIDESLHDEAGVRPTGAAVGADARRVGVDNRELGPVVGHLVRTGQLGDGDDRYDHAVRRVGAGIVDEGAVHSQDVRLRVDGDPRGMELAALLVGRNEVLAPIFGPFDGLSQLDRRPRHEHLFGEEQHDLGAEAAAHVRRDDLDLEFRQAEHVGQAVLDRERRLSGIPNGERLLQRVEDSHHAASLDGAAARAFDRQVLLEHVRGGAECGIRIADDLLQARRDVVGHVVMDPWLARFGRHTKVNNRRQRLPVDFDQISRIFSDVAILGDDHRDRLADVADLVHCQWALRPAMRQVGMRHDERRGLVELAQIGGRIHRPHAGLRPRPGNVDPDNPSVAVRAAQDRRVEHTRRIDVVDE